MALVQQNEAKTFILDIILGRATYDDLSLHLFINNRTPTVFDNITQYTELAIPSYSSKTIDKNLWVSSIILGNTALATYPVQEWTFTASSSITVYGGFIKRISTGKLWAAETFLTPFTIKNTGDKVKWVVAISLGKF